MKKISEKQDDTKKSGKNVRRISKNTQIFISIIFIVIRFYVPIDILSFFSDVARLSYAATYLVLHIPLYLICLVILACGISGLVKSRKK